jgi:hypothetical protein
MYSFMIMVRVVQLVLGSHEPESETSASIPDFSSFVFSIVVCFSHIAWYLPLSASNSSCDPRSTILPWCMTTI